MPWDVETAKQRCLERDWQLWAVRANRETLGSVITEIYDTAAGKTAAMPVVGGKDLASWVHLLSVVEAWARHHGCVRLEGVGRAGWERALRPYGWEKIAVTVAKTL